MKDKGTGVEVVVESRHQLTGEIEGGVWAWAVERELLIHGLECALARARMNGERLRGEG